MKKNRTSHSKIKGNQCFRINIIFIHNKEKSGSCRLAKIALHKKYCYIYSADKKRVVDVA